MSDSDSSEPTGTSEEEDLDMKPQIEEESDLDPENEEIFEKTKKSGAKPYVFIIILDYLIPLMLMLLALSTLSLIGLLLIVLMIVHVIVCRTSSQSKSNYKIMLIVEMAVSLILVIVSVFMYSYTDTPSQIMEIIGISFQTYVTSGPTMCLVCSLIALILTVIAIGIYSSLSTRILRSLRERIMTSKEFEFVIDLIWTFCLTFNAATNFSYIFAPLLLYYAYLSITYAILGRTGLPFIVSYIVYAYNILNNLYIFYESSYFPESASLKDYLAYSSMGKNIRPLLAIVTMISSYTSVTMMTIKGFATTRRKYSKKQKDIIGFFAYIGLLCLIIFAMYYPSWIGTIWVALCVIAFFTPKQFLFKVMMKIITIFFNISFIVMAITSFNALQEFSPGPKASEFYDETNSSKLLDDFPEYGYLYKAGLFRYTNNYSTSLIGFMLAALLSQSVRVLAAETMDQPPKKTEEEEEPSKFKLFLFKAYDLAVAIIRYCAVGLLVVITATLAYLDGRYVLKVLFIFTNIISLFSLYSRPAFIVLQVVSGLDMILNCYAGSSIYISQYRAINNVYYDDKFIPSFLEPTVYIPATNEEPFNFAYPEFIVFVVSVYLYYDKGAINMKYPRWFSNVIYLLVCICHFVFMFSYETSIFTIIYLWCGMLILTFQVIGKPKILMFMNVLSKAALSLHLFLLMATHFESIRPYFNETFMKPFFDIDDKAEPSFLTVLLSLTLYISSMATTTYSRGAVKDSNSIGHHILELLKRILNIFYFYISWVLVFLLSVANSYPTCIKFVFQILFLLGSKIASFFAKMQSTLVILFLLIVTVDLYFQMSPTDDPYINSLLEYIGFFLVPRSDHTISARNAPLAVNLAFLIISVINISSSNIAPCDKDFGETIGMRIFDGLTCALSSLLPVIVQALLCISTFFNPSIFGYLSFVVLILVTYNKNFLKDHAALFTIFFNICFIVQYIMWLDIWPNPNNFDPSFFDGIQDENLLNWLRFFGVYDVTTIALISNCLSSMALTFYLQYSNVFIDANQSFSNLPKLCQSLVNFFVTYIYEITVALIVIVQSLNPHLDGLLMNILVMILFFAVLLFDYSKSKMMTVISLGTFLVIFAHLLSRIPVFTEEGFGEYIMEIFDIPFRGQSSSEYLWIIAFCLQRICLHILDCDIYRVNQQAKTERTAYRLIRSQQIRIITRLDQEIIKIRQDNEIEKIRQSTELDLEQISNKPQKLVSTTSAADIAQALSDMEKDSKKAKVFSFFNRMFKNFVKHTTILIAESIDINNETGINVLTLQSLTTIMKRYLRSYTQDKEFLLEAREQDFIRSLPPSFLLHFQSLAPLLDFKVIEKKHLKENAFRYYLYLIRRIPFIMICLISLIYVLMRPNILSVIYFAFTFVFVITLQIPYIPIYFYIIEAFGSLILVLRSISHLKFLAPSLMSLASSVSTAQMSIDAFSLFGLDPYDDSVVEIFVFLCTIMFIVDQSAQCRIYPPSHYNEVLKKNCKNYPEAFCYESLIDNLEETFGLTAKPKPLIQLIEDSMTRFGLIESAHYLWTLVVDLISIIFIAAAFNSWISDGGSDTRVYGASNDLSSVSFGYILVLVLQIMQLFFCYFFQISSNFLYLEIYNIVSFAYDIIIVLFVVDSSKGMPASAIIYFLIRFINHVICGHRTKCGKIFMSFKFPDFKNDSLPIQVSNYFFRICPFVFEFKTILSYMASDTLSTLWEYLVICDIKSQLEINIVNAIKLQEKSYEEMKKPKHNKLIGIFAIFCMLLLALFPLLFFIQSGTDTQLNPLVDAKMKIGLEGLPILYENYANISGITNNNHNVIGSSSDDNLNTLKYADKDQIFKVKFPLQSGIYYQDFPGKADLSKTLSSTSPRLYISIELNFNTATTAQLTQNIFYREEAVQSASFYTDYTSPNTTLPINLMLPSVIFVPSKGALSTLPYLGREFDILLTSNTGKTFSTIDWDEGNSKSPTGFDFLNDEGYYSFLVWSQPVPEGGVAGATASSNNVSLIGIYILLLLIFGQVLREYSFGEVHNLWITRTKKPEKLYKMCLAVEAFRATGDIEKEQEMAVQLLEIVRSQEAVIQLTNME